MSKLAKCMCGLYIICSSTLVGKPVVQNEIQYDTQIIENSDSANEEKISDSEIQMLSSGVSEGNSSSQHQPKKHGQVINIDSSLSIRKDPDINSEVYYGLYKGMTFDILKKEGDWYNIRHDDVEGYVNKTYVIEYDEKPPYQVYESSASTTSAKNRAEISRGGNLNKAIKAELTAYCNCRSCSEAWGSKTAMQTKTRVGVVAAPKNIPLGSKLYIPELKSYKSDCMFNVEDRGGAIKIKKDGTYVIDVWLPTHEQVKKFGRKKTYIYLVE